MTTPLNRTSKADIKRRLNGIVDYHLFESTNWPIAGGDAVGSFWQTVRDMGPYDSCGYTALGIHCGTELAACFIGAHEPFEVPMILREHGLIEECEEESFDLCLIDEVHDEEVVLRHVEVLVRRAHGRLLRKDIPVHRCVVIEGPLPHDVDFKVKFLEAAKQADMLWERLAFDDLEPDELWEKFCSYNPLNQSLEFGPDLDFSTTARSFVEEWLTNGASVLLSVSDSRGLENFCAMLFVGFFVQTGDRYQMVIPDVIDVTKVCEGLKNWLKHMDQEKLNPRDLLVTLPARDAKARGAKLSRLKPAARMADRAILLDDLSSQQTDQTK